MNNVKALFVFAVFTCIIYAVKNDMAYAGGPCISGPPPPYNKCVNFSSAKSYPGTTFVWYEHGNSVRKWKFTLYSQNGRNIVCSKDWHRPVVGYGSVDCKNIPKGIKVGVLEYVLADNFGGQDEAYFK